MSSIVIAGDTSGSVTLQAPAVAGSTSVNLPSTLGNTSTSAFATTDSSGNLGLGVTPSAWSGFTASQVGNTAIWSTSTNNSHFSSNVYYNGSNRIYIGTNTATEYTQQSGQHKLFTAASGTAGNVITLTQVFALEGGKSLALEGATSQTGTGITFPATQSASSDANTLDDYEEGSFTATLTCTTSGTITLGYTTLFYTKIGRQVSILGYLGVNSVSSPVGNVQLNGLPFTVLGSSIARPTLNVKTTGLAATAVTTIMGELNENTTTGTIFKYSAGSVSALAGDVQASAHFVLSSTYFTT